MKKSSDTALLPFEAEHAAGILAAKVRTARIARGWTQAELASRSDLSERTVTSMEAGSVSVQMGFWLKALWAHNRWSGLCSISPPGLSVYQSRLGERPGPDSRLLSPLARAQAACCRTCAT